MEQVGRTLGIFLKAGSQIENFFCSPFNTQSFCVFNAVAQQKNVCS